MNAAGSGSPIILGVSFGGHDTSAALIKNGTIVAACEQERYSLEKHTREFPSDAIKDCLRIASISIDDVDELALQFDPRVHIRKRYLEPALDDVKNLKALLYDPEEIRRNLRVEEDLRENTGFRGPISFHLHHLCHSASAYYPSGFDAALLLSHDGVGEIESGRICSGVAGEIETLDCSNNYPDSLGLLYSAITVYLGWKHHSDEGIVMGLASYGDAQATIPSCGRSYSALFDEIIQETGPYSYQIERSWISYHQTEDLLARQRRVSNKFIEVFGPPRNPGEPWTSHHKNVAAALQDRLESIVLNQLQWARKEFGFRKLALAGGVSLNCSMNGKIEASRLFDEIYVQPASGDNGTAIGACFLSHKQLVGELKPIKNHNTFLGSRFTEAEIQNALRESQVDFEICEDVHTLTADRLAEGKIVGWFQGAAEFGPRALGNRSILVKPYPAEMKDYLNQRVKFREGFRPYAPAVLAEHANEYFQIGQESPHMLIATKATESRKEQIPAVVHVDDTCRVQTVTPEDNSEFRRLLEAFFERTGCPVLLNTSFNVKGQPIVNSPQQAVDCFLSTEIDLLVIGNYFVEKN